MLVMCACEHSSLQVAQHLEDSFSAVVQMVVFFQRYYAFLVLKGLPHVQAYSANGLGWVVRRGICPHEALHVDQCPYGM